MRTRNRRFSGREPGRERSPRSGIGASSTRICWRPWTGREKSQISLTDPDSRAMAAHTPVAVGYNVQVAVDAKHKLIVEQQVTSQDCGYMGLLAPDRRTSQRGSRRRADRGRRRPGLFQDRGHCRRPARRPGSILTCHVPRRGPSVRASLFRKDEFSYDPARESFLCPAGQQLHPYSSSLIRGRRRSITATARPAATARSSSPVHGQSIPLRVSFRERGRIGPHAGPHSAAPRHPRSTPRDRRAPFRLDQAVDEPGRVSDARIGEGSAFAPSSA